MLSMQKICSYTVWRTRKWETSHKTLMWFTGSCTANEYWAILLRVLYIVTDLWGEEMRWGFASYPLLINIIIYCPLTSTAHTYEHPHPHAYTCTHSCTTKRLPWLGVEEPFHTDNTSGSHIKQIESLIVFFTRQRCKKQSHTHRESVTHSKYVLCVILCLYHVNQVLRGWLPQQTEEYMNTRTRVYRWLFNPSLTLCPHYYQTPLFVALLALFVLSLFLLLYCLILFFCSHLFHLLPLKTASFKELSSTFVGGHNWNQRS